ncbi:MAG: DUF3578 domain-containing protein, partial [Blastocatellia bacterium]|nr:DUF3578 domain-containing protein [Blastocatellia bacterium]
MEQIDIGIIQGSLGAVLSNYIEARQTKPFKKDQQIWQLFQDLQQSLKASDPFIKRPQIRIDWSVGKGNWATIPWITFVDKTQEDAPQDGLCCAIYFRQDMTGIYLGLTYGRKAVLKKLGRSTGLKELKTLAEKARKNCLSLTEAGFLLDSKIDLKTSSTAQAEHAAATVAYKFYSADAIPDDGEILQDIDLLLSVYLQQLVPEKTVKSSFIKTEKFDLASAMSELVESISLQGFLFEPWQIAAYVTALRTKPFVILAGVSGTGKSKLPKLIADATGGYSDLIPVRPDWTDSSELLGYIDLQNKFRIGRLLELARRASDNPDRQFFAIIDEMNIARVEHYFAEVLSKMEDRRASKNGNGYESSQLLSYRLSGSDAVWSSQVLPPNFTITGTVNMDETTHSFSRKVLDRAFTLEFSEIDFNLLKFEKIGSSRRVLWPVSAWQPKAIRIAELKEFSEKEQLILEQTISSFSELNKFLIQAQLQVGYRTLDEVALFLIHSQDLLSSFITKNGEKIDPLDLALQMKLLPRISG